MHDTQHILQLADSYQKTCLQGLVKLARIRKLPGGKYRVLSEKGKNLGTSDTKGEAVKRLRQVEWFKHHDKNKAEDKVIDLTGAPELAYSAIMREMRQKAEPQQIRAFLKIYKQHFDNAVKDELQKPEKVALQNALVQFNKRFKIKVDKKLIKNAAISELGDPAIVGKYLSDIVKFTLNRIEPEKRVATIDKLRQKFYSFNADEIAAKTMPPTSAIGQSITFVKHVLFNHEPTYVREVLKSLVRNL
jgi:hypothetical protein